MSIQWQTVPVPLGIGGVETRSDSKVVQPPKLLRLENGTFATPGAVQKRLGGTALGNKQLRVRVPLSAGARALETVPIVDAKAIFGYGEELLMETNEDVLAYSPALDQWLPVGPAPTLRIGYGLSTSPPQDSIGAADMAVADGLVVTAYVDLFPAARDDLSIQVIDQSTGQVLQRRQLDTSSGRPMVVAIANAVLVFWVKAALLKMVRVTRSELTLWEASGPVIATVVSDLQALNLYDVTVSAGRVMLAYSSNAGTIKFGYIDPTGVLDGTFATETPAAVPTAITVAVEPVARTIAIAWSMDSVPMVAVRMWDVNKTPLWARIDLIGIESARLAGVFVTVIGSSAELRLFMENKTGPAAVPENRQVYQRRIIVTGVSTGSSLWARHAGIASKPWVENRRVYCVLVHESALQSVYFIQRASNYMPDVSVAGVNGYYTQRDYAVLAAMFYGTAAGLALVAPGAIGFQPGVPSVVPIGGGRYLWTAIVRDLRDDVQKDFRRMVPLEFDFSQPAQWAEYGGAAFGTGGVLWRLDADTLVEQGFLLYPEGVTATPSNSTGTLTSSTTYIYRVFYEWTFPGGEREQSTAVDVSVLLGAADDTVTLVIPTLGLTNKTLLQGATAELSISIYRRKQGEVVSKRVSSMDPTAVGSNGYVINTIGILGFDTVTFVDELSDIAIAGNEADYLSGNECENIPPGPCTVITAGNERLLVSGAQDITETRPSKLRGFGEAVSFSDALAMAVSAGIGPMTGLATLGLSWVIFRERQVFVVNGPGPDNVLDSNEELAGGTYESPAVVSDTIGCINARSITRVPAGVVFQSAKGFQLLTKGLELQYIGADVERYNSEFVTSAVNVVDNHEVRITLASGVVLVWDYLVQQWATWNIPILSAVMWQDQWVYLVDTAGTVRKEVAGQYDDAGMPYSLLLETAPLPIAGLQGCQRVRRLLFLGEFRGHHKPRVWVSYDNEDAWYGPFDWEAASVVNTEKYGDGTPYGSAPNGANGTYGGNVVGPSGDLLFASTQYQFQVSLPRQKCSSIRVRIEEQPRSGGIYPLREGFRLTEMAIEVGRRRGAVHLGNDRRTG